MAVTSLDSVIGQSLSGLSTSAGNAGGVSGSILSMPSSANNATPNRYDVVTLSKNVPQPIEATTLETADTLAGKLAGSYTLSRKEKAALSESRVLAALTGMRLIHSVSGQTQKIWTGGLPRPSTEEMDEAYKRLTQKLSKPAQSKDFEAVNEVRTQLLDDFRDADFAALAALPGDDEAPVAPVAEAEPAAAEPTPAETADTAPAESSEPTPPPAASIRLVA